MILAVLQLTLAAATTACLLLLGTARALGFLLSILLSVASRLHTYFLLIGFSAKLALLHTKVKQLKPNLDVLELRDA